MVLERGTAELAQGGAALRAYAQPSLSFLADASERNFLQLNLWLQGPV